MTDSEEIPDTSTCGCCRTIEEDTTHTNKPGQPAIRYRIGTHGSILRRMIRTLPLQEVRVGNSPTLRPLAKLTTQETSDPSVALLDAFAIVADIITFYQERIANECYLRTSAERRSVLELAREIGYELNPGVAASTYLAFTVETAKGAPESVPIGKGTKVQSIPAPGKQPQTFETSEELVARPEWNALKPTTTRVHDLKSGETVAYLQNVNLGLKPGEYLLFVGDERLNDPENERWDVRQIAEVQEFPKDGYTRVSWQEGLGGEKNGHFVPPAETNLKIYVFRQRASLFGHNAVDWCILSDEVKASYLKSHGISEDPQGVLDWKKFTISEMPRSSMEDSTGTIFLDTIYHGIVPGTWSALSIPDYIELYRITHVAEDSQTGFALTAKTTRLTIEGENLIEIFDKKIRETVVLLGAEELRAAKKPYDRNITGMEIVIDGTTKGLPPGKTLIISGLSSVDGSPVCETAVIEDIRPRDSTIIFTEDLKNSYRRGSVTIFGNVVHATHGETRSEVLGSGDAGLAHQQFTLKKPPLTYVPASTPSGGKSTLSVRVDGLEWTECAALFKKDGMSEHYTIRIADDAKAVVIFGDGIEGTRLTTGTENITAVYRSGIGPDGEMAKGTLSLLPIRPIGIREVTNPMAATGAAGPEDRDNARDNAPLKVRTLDRIVSLRDYEDFSRAYTGIARARADPVWSGEELIVLITVLGPGGKPIREGSVADPGPLEHLHDSIAAWQDPEHSVRIKSAVPLYFDVHVSVLFDSPRYAQEAVCSSIRDTLQEAFSFEKVEFGQNVYESALINVIQGVPGVLAVSIDQFTILPDCSSSVHRPQVVVKEKALYRRYLPAKPAAFSKLHNTGTEHISGAEILLICPDRITISGWKP